MNTTASTLLASASPLAPAGFVRRVTIRLSALAAAATVGVVIAGFLVPVADSPLSWLALVLWANMTGMA